MWEAGSRRIVIVNVKEAVRVVPSEGVDEVGGEGEEINLTDSSLFKVNGSVCVLSKVRATRRYETVSISQTDGTKVNEVGYQWLRNDMVHSDTGFEDADENSFVVIGLASLDFSANHAVHEENSIVQVA